MPKQAQLEEKVSAAVVRYNLEKFVSLRLNERSIEATIDQEKVQAAKQLDGCYALVTDFDKESCSAEMVQDLAQVESAFRLLKSSLDVRPLWHRRADGTRAHVFLVMLSLVLLEEFQRRIQDLGTTTEAAIDALNNIQLSNLKIGKDTVKKLPSELRQDQSAILKALKPRLPSLVKLVSWPFVYTNWIFSQRSKSAPALDLNGFYLWLQKRRFR